MEILEFTLFLLACVLVSSIIDQFVPRLSSPLIQIALGIIVFFIANGQYDFSIDNNLFMVLFVAPLLYNEARHASKETLLKNRGSILSLAIGLVVVLTLVVGFSLNALVPSIPLAAAFALGAALGPTDAVAVTSLPEEVRLGPRREGILQGECLINDASGIVAFQFSIAAVITGAFSAVDATVNFLILFIGGIIVGIVLGFLCLGISRFMRNRGLDNTTFHVLFDLFLPFIVYFAAEYLHVSGILAVVAAGIVNSGMFSTAKTKHLSPTVSKMSIVSTSVWEVFIFALNGIVFVMLGAMLPEAMISTWQNPAFDNVSLVMFVLAIVALIVIVRFLWILVHEKRYNNNHDNKMTDKEVRQSAWIMTIGGAKGAVTMAIMFTIPATLADGSEFPGRSVLMFIAGGVIITTLILSNFLLPMLMPQYEKIKQQKEAGMREDLDYVTIEVLRKVIENLTSQIDDTNRSAIQNVINTYSKRIADIKKTNDIDDKLNISCRARAYRYEREFVASEFRQQNISPAIARKYLRNLDNKEDLLVHHTSLTWKMRNYFLRSKNYAKLLPKRTKNIVEGDYAQPGETEKFSTKFIEKAKEPINNMDDLRKAAYTHVIKMLEEEMQDISAPNEDITNVLNDYRTQLQALKEKSPSLSTIRSVQKDTVKYTREALSLELEYIQNEYENKSITRQQYRWFCDNVLLMQVALEEF